LVHDLLHFLYLLVFFPRIVALDFSIILLKCFQILLQLFYFKTNLIYFLQLQFIINQMAWVKLIIFLRKLIKIKSSRWIWDTLALAIRFSYLLLKGFNFLTHFFQIVLAPWFSFHFVKFIVNLIDLAELIIQNFYFFILLGLDILHQHLLVDNLWCPITEVLLHLSPEIRLYITEHILLYGLSHVLLQILLQLIPHILLYLIHQVHVQLTLHFLHMLLNLYLHHL